MGLQGNHRIVDIGKRHDGAVNEYMKWRQHLTKSFGDGGRHGIGLTLPEQKQTRNSRKYYVISADPCAPNKDNVILPDPLSNSAYYVCYKGKGYRADCDRQKVFDEKQSMCVNP